MSDIYPERFRQLKPITIAKLKRYAERNQTFSSKGSRFLEEGEFSKLYPDDNFAVGVGQGTQDDNTLPDTFTVPDNKFLIDIRPGTGIIGGRYYSEDQLNPLNIDTEDLVDGGSIIINLPDNPKDQSGVIGIPTINSIEYQKNPDLDDETVELFRYDSQTNRFTRVAVDEEVDFPPLPEHTHQPVKDNLRYLQPGESKEASINTRTVSESISANSTKSINIGDVTDNEHNLTELESSVERDFNYYIVANPIADNSNIQHSSFINGSKEGVVFINNTSSDSLVVEIDVLIIQEAVEAVTEFFDVTIDSAPAQSKPGSTVTVDFTINNTGAGSGTQNVSLVVNNGVGTVDSKQITVNSGGSQSDTLSWSTANNQTEQTYQLEVVTDDTTDSQSINIVDSNYTVGINTTTSPVNDGNTLNVTSTISNTKAVQDIKTVSLNINNGVGTVDSQSVTLNGNDSTIITLSWSVPSGQTKQSYNATVASPDDTDSVGVQVKDENFTTAITSTSSPVNPGDTLFVNTDITNTVNNTGSQTVTLDINNGVGQVDSKSVSITGNNTQQITLSWSVPSGQTAQSYQATVSTNNDTASTSINVQSQLTLPSSARNQWSISNASGSTVPDGIGSSTGTLNGANRVTNRPYKDNVGINSTGSTSQYLDLGLIGNFGSSLDTDFAVAVTFVTNTTPSGGTLLFGQSSSNGSGGTSGDATTLGIVPKSDTTIKFRLKDQDNDALAVETPSLDSPISDGNLHRYLFNKTSNSASGLEVYQDAVKQSKTITSSASTFGNVIDFDLNGVQMLRKQFNGGFTTSPLTGTIDNIVIYDSSLSSSEIQDDFDLQPWN
jgi:hypothetical protein